MRWLYYLGGRKAGFHCNIKRENMTKLIFEKSEDIKVYIQARRV